MKPLQRLQALACAALLGGVISAQAVSPVTSFFDITWTSGALNGTTSTGSFTYDSMLLTGVGPEYLGSDSGFLAFSLDVDGNLFSLGNDISLGSPSFYPGNPAYPVVLFNNGVFDGLDYLASSGTSFLALSTLDAEFGIGVNDSEGTITLRRTPPPTNTVPDGGATVSLLMAGLGAITLARRKLKA